LNRSRPVGETVAAPKDLKLLATLRHEIIHFLRYTQMISSETVPRPLIELDRRGLLIDSGDSKADFHFTQKLSSYALAYWACEAALETALTLSTFYDRTRMISPVFLADNFAVHRQILSPTDLKKFD
jgi:hypothetical protein